MKICKSSKNNAYEKKLSELSQNVEHQNVREHKLGYVLRIRIIYPNYDFTPGFNTKTKLGFRIKSGLAAFIEKSAKEFRESIINENKLTRGDAHRAYCVKNSKNVDREIPNSGCLKIADFEICVQSFEIEY